MKTNEVRELLRAAQEAVARIGTSKALPSDKPIINNALRLLAGDAMRLAARAQMLAPKVIVETVPPVGFDDDQPLSVQEARSGRRFKIDFSKKVG